METIPKPISDNPEIQALYDFMLEMEKDFEYKLKQLKDEVWKLEDQLSSAKYDLQLLERRID